MPATKANNQDLLLRFRRWAVWAIGGGVILYVGGSVWAGFEQVGGELGAFSWPVYAVVLALTLLNYGLRFGKWHYLLGRLGVRIPVGEDATIFLAGLAMVISPGKAGELLKPYLVSRRTGTPMSTTLPALITERLTDGIAMLALAAISVGTYASDKVHWIAIPSAIVAAGMLILASKRASMGILAVLGRLPGLSRVAPKLVEMYLAMRTCLAPAPLLITLLLSLVAWWAECVGFWLVLEGLGQSASLDASTFLYAFATVAGGAMPGGLGVADGALSVGAITIMGASEAVAVTAALLIRVATLWFGVLMGALALFRFEDLLHQGISEDAGVPAEEPDSGP
ncbi:MAG: flippase-like domain-containing protein [Alphaproteobacteria bacterium]|nr:flippase-like domain-containing protein [Alphaproteobacteria bacterium]